jgi:NADH-quinone oxidoreductase subunit J
MIGQLLSNMQTFFSSGANIMFMVFALLAIGGAVFMLNFTKVIHMVISLSVTFISLAAIYVMLQAEFVGVVQVLIYAGAITILMIFGIMMTNHREIDQEVGRPLHHVFVIIGVLVLFVMIFYAVQQAVFPFQDVDLATKNTENIGLQLFTLHVIPFELMSVLLTVAFIGAIIIAKREEE